MQSYDYVIIGAGIFGVFTAIHLSKKGARVLIIEKENKPLLRASCINQARLHGGYHYPRSIATARSSHQHKERFYRDHFEMMNDQFTQYYGIDKYSSSTSASQFEEFCGYLKIPLRKSEIPTFLNQSNLESIYITQEFSFDPFKLSTFYQSKIKQESRIEITLGTTISKVERSQDSWTLYLDEKQYCAEDRVNAKVVVNATYSSLNVINELFDQSLIDLQHEITEIVLASSSLKQIGLTVMDGDFASFMPFGQSNLLSLSSVRYTRHYTSFENFPSFPCQANNPGCSPRKCAKCNGCTVRPRSNYQKMIRQIYKYVSPHINFDYTKSIYTIKSKLRNSYIDDSRPTLILQLSKEPDFHCIFGGKVSSIYQIEEHFQ